MAAIDHIYRYAQPSSLEKQNDGSLLRLAAELNDQPEMGFFEGLLLEPQITAKCLRAVSDLVGTRFYAPPSMLARILREADPVATVSPEHVRFEGFSACCSTYIRHDMTSNSFDAERQNHGTTNVDFQAEMRAMLARIRGDTPLKLVIHKDAVELHQPSESIIERKVPLPVRWLKGFAEVQSHLSGMESKFTLSRVQAQRFLRSLPRVQADQQQWVSPTAQGARLSVRATPNGVAVKGTQRLHVFEKLASHAKKMDVWFNERLGSSAWSLDFGAQRLMLVLNSEPWRGFSGDGTLLSHLASANSSTVAAVKAQLNWQESLDPDQVVKIIGQSSSAVSKAFGILAAQGLLGFDLLSGGYFHRVLPYDLSLIDKLNPRLKSATALVQKNAVAIIEKELRIIAEVDSSGISHQVIIETDQSSCTCPWYSKHNNTRGPCKHILATEMTLEQSS